jgi:hypothetical protein
MGADAIGRCADAEGNLRCVDVQCKSVHQVQHIVLQAGDQQHLDVVDKLMDLRTFSVLKKALPEALDGERARLTAEFQRIQSIADLDERASEVLRLEVVENILNLKCPGPTCGAVVYDFDGCFAVKCAKCDADFCAWCMKGGQPGVDMHGHVRSCLENGGRGLYGTQHDFRQHHQRRKGRLIKERLASETADIRQRVEKRLAADLVDGVYTVTLE